ncbi:MAG: dienelactone hydrolase family protein [Gemmatimonadaceae bacterium]|nr:dienelactone hydrolase family protein [Gemmatimonadaceae bacterium]
MSRRLAIVSSIATTTLVFAAYTLRHGATPASAADLDDHSAHMRAEDRMAPMTMSISGAGSQQDDLSLPASAATTAARLAASPRHGEWVTFASTPGSKDSIMAWVVYPATKNKAPVVVVVHEIFGLSSWVRAVADQVAAEGFIAIAPDFLSRVRGGPSSVELKSDTATRLIRGVDAAERNRVIAAAANYAMMLPAAKQKYAVIGYCWGGQTTFYHGINGGLKGFSGGVAFYGLPYTSGGTPATATTAAVPASLDVDSLRKIKQPIMLLNGSKDARIAAAMPALDSIMKKLKKKYTGVNYDGAVHGFLRAQADGRAPRAATATQPAETEADVAKESAANLAATKDGWPKTIAFLKKNLGVK